MLKSSGNPQNTPSLMRLDSSTSSSSNSTSTSTFTYTQFPLIFLVDRNSSSSTGVFNRKPPSALSKIGKHIPPPISPIIAFKSTTTTGSPNVTASNNENKSKKDSSDIIQDSHSPGSSTLSQTSSSSCAWRKPTPPVERVQETSSRPFSLPQRKVPSLTPDNPIKEVPVKVAVEAKSFLERPEEFPTLPTRKIEKGQEPKDEQAIESEIVKASPSPLVPCKSYSKLGGDFNFLEDDDWLEGDNIDYSQVLFEDTEHFLSFTPTRNTSSEATTSTLSVIQEDVSKAKDLLAQRSHSSKKQDIWKHTTTSETTATMCQSSKVKIKILKRATPCEVQDVQRPELLTQKVKAQTKKAQTLQAQTKGIETQTEPAPVTAKKFSTAKKSQAERTGKLTEKIECLNSKLENIKISTVNASPPPTTSKPERIVYSSTSKTLKKLP